MFLFLATALTCFSRTALLVRPAKLLARPLLALHGNLAVLPQCIDVLFSFLRRSVGGDSLFVNDAKAWTRRLVSALSLFGTLHDHRYILNHIARSLPLLLST